MIVLDKDDEIVYSDELAGFVEVIVRPDPFRERVFRSQVAEGQTLQEIIGSMMIMRGCVPRVFIDDYGPVPAEWWPRIRPRAGHRVTIRAWPRGSSGRGNNKGVLGIIIGVVLIVVGLVMLYYGIPGGAQVALMGVSMVVGGVINMLIATPLPKLSEKSGNQGKQSFALSGTQNTARPYDPVPRVYGTYRVFPPYGALPYTEIVGDLQYLRILFVIGYGPMDITDLQIGTTAIANFKEVETEIRQGYPGDAPLTLYTNDIFEEPLTINLARDLTTHIDPAPVRQTHDVVDEWSVDFVFQFGLFHIDGDGNMVANSTNIKVWYRKLGDVTWILASDANYTGVTAFPTRRSVRVRPGSGYSQLQLTWVPQAYYRFSEKSGALIDSGSHNFPGTAVGTGLTRGVPGLLPNDPDFAITFPGNTSNYLTPNANTALIIHLNSFTWVFLFRTKQTTAATFYEASSGPGGQNGILIDLNVAGVGIIRAVLDNTVFANSGAGSHYNDGLIHHVAVVFDRGTALLKLYIDGVLKSSVDASAENGIDLSSAGTHIGSNLHGTMDEFSMSSFAASAAQILALYNATPLPATRATYEVKVQQTAGGIGTGSLGSVNNAATWSALRSILYQSPITKTGLAMVAMRIRATDQLNGVVNQFSCLVKSRLTAWDRVAGAWVPDVVTSNPAAVYRDVLQGSANARPVTDDRLDLPALQAWHEACDDNGFSFNGVFDTRSTVFDTLREVAVTGRGSFHMKDGKFSIVRDVAQTVPIQHFTPRNSQNFRGTKVFLDFPHALKVQFINPDMIYQRDELIVYDDGFSVANATKFEVLETFGVTDKNLAFKLGRYYLAAARLRPEVFELDVDVENLVCSRGDLVKVVHDVPSFGLGYARLKSTTVDGSGNLLTITIDDIFAMVDGNTYAVRIRLNDGSTLLLSVVTVPGNNSTLTLVTPHAPPLPQKNDLVLFGFLNAESVDLLVKSISPTKDLAAHLSFVAAAPAVLTADQGPIPPFQSYISSGPQFIQNIPPAPIIDAIVTDEKALVRNSDGSWQIRILATLHFISATVVPIAFVEASWRLSAIDEGPFAKILHAAGPGTQQVSIVPVYQDQTYDLKFRAIGAHGEVSDYVNVLGVKVVGFGTPPPDVTAFVRDGDILRWTYDTTLADFAGFHLRRQFGDNRIWSTAQPLHPGVIPGPTFPIPFDSHGTWTYLLKAIDVAGNESVNAAIIITGLGDLALVNGLRTVDCKALGFPGTITNGSIFGGNLQANSTTLFWPADNQIFYGSNASVFWPTVTYLALQYVTTLSIDESEKPVDILLDVTAAGTAWSLEYRLSSITAFWSADSIPTGDSLPFWSGTDSKLFWIGEVGASGWLPWLGSIRQATKSQYDFRLTGQEGLGQTIVSVFRILLDVPDTGENLPNVVIAATTGTRLPSTRTYRSIKFVGLTLQADGGTAVTAIVVDKDSILKPLVKCLNSAGVAVQGLVDATIIGT